MKKFLGFFWKGKRKIIVIILLLALAIFSYLSRGAKPTAYDAVTINKGYISETVYLNAKTASANKADIYAQSSGDLKELKVKLGDKVKVGDVLMILENEDLKKRREDLVLERSIQSSSGGNTIESSKLNYEQAQKTYESNKQLYDAGVISKEALDNSKFAAESAYETYKSSRSAANTNSLRIQNVNLQIDRVDEQIQKLVITSNTDGVVSEIPFKEGDKVPTGQIVCRVQDDSVLYVDSDVNQFDVKKIRVGQEVSIYENLPNAPNYSAEVYEISPIGKEGTKDSEVSIPIRIKFDNSKDVFRSNYSLKVKIVTKENNDALLIPYDAVAIDPAGNKTVYKYQDEKVQAIPVEYGIMGDLSVEAISEGLKEGDVLVLNPDAKLPTLPVVQINLKDEQKSVDTAKKE